DPLSSRPVDICPSDPERYEGSPMWNRFGHPWFSHDDDGTRYDAGTDVADVFPGASSFSFGGGSSSLAAAPAPAIGPSFIETTDAANNSGTIYTIAVGQTAQGTISSLGDHDWYAVNLVAGQTYSFAEIGTGTNGLEDTYLYLRNASGTILKQDDDSG